MGSSIDVWSLSKCGRECDAVAFDALGSLPPSASQKETQLRGRVNVSSHHRCALASHPQRKSGSRRFTHSDFGPKGPQTIRMSAWRHLGCHFAPYMMEAPSN